MSDVERITPGRRVWRHPNEEPPPRRPPGQEPSDGEKPEDNGQDAPKDDQPEDGHIDVFVKSPAPTTPPP